MKLNRLMIFLMLLLLVGLLSVIIPNTVAQSMNFGSNWTAQYYPNTTFSGSPSASIVIQQVNENFGSNAPPYAGMPPDNFSIRYSGSQSIPDGTWQFTAVVDGGVRVSVDGIIIIDQLGATGSNTFQAQAILNGTTHQVQVDYVEDTGVALVQFSWTQVGTAPTAGPSPTMGPTLTPSNTPLPAIPAGAITATVIRAAVLNVRDAPSLGGNRVGRILRGQTYAVVGTRPECALVLAGIRWQARLGMGAFTCSSTVTNSHRRLPAPRQLWVFPPESVTLGVLGANECRTKITGCSDNCIGTNRTDYVGCIPAGCRTHIR